MLKTMFFGKNGNFDQDCGEWKCRQGDDISVFAVPSVLRGPSVLRTNGPRPQSWAEPTDYQSSLPT